MPFAMPITKARRPRKPSWQDVRPDSKGLRDLYRIAARHERRFARAMSGLTSSLLSDPQVVRNVKRAVRAGNVNGAVNAIPFLNPQDESSIKRWSRFFASIEDVYADVMREGGQSALAEVGIRRRFTVQKKDRKIDPLPPNPFSERWIKENAAKLVKEVSESVKQSIRDVILEGYTRGERISTIMDMLMRSGRFGLLSREQRWVHNVGQRMRDEGASEQAVQDAMDRKAEHLGKLRRERIARTETIRAQAEGRNEAWQQSQEEGLLPQDIKRQWLAAGSSGRTCKRCVDMNLRTAGINEPFESSYVGSIMNPPLHPACRCGTTLLVPGLDDDDVEDI